MSTAGGGGTGYVGYGWVDATTPSGKRRQQRPSLPPAVLERFLVWRDSMLLLADRFRAAAPRLVTAAARSGDLVHVVVPQRRQGGLRGKRSAVEQQAFRGVLLAEWSLVRPPPGVRPLRPLPPEPSDVLYLLADGRLVLRRSGPDVLRPLRFVDDADFVQLVHREGLTEQIRRRLVALFRNAEMAAPFVPNRPHVDHADVWGKVARPEEGTGGAPGDRG